MSHGLMKAGPISSNGDSSERQHSSSAPGGEAEAVPESAERPLCPVLPVSTLTGAVQ